MLLQIRRKQRNYCGDVDDDCDVCDIEELRRYMRDRGVPESVVANSVRSLQYQVFSGRTTTPLRLTRMWRFYCKSEPLFPTELHVVHVDIHSKITEMERLTDVLTEHVFRSFDFVHSCVLLEVVDGEWQFRCSDDAYGCVAQRKLQFNGTPRQTAELTVFRVMKFLSNGFSFDGNQLV